MALIDPNNPVHYRLPVEDKVEQMDVLIQSAKEEIERLNKSLDEVIGKIDENEKEALIAYIGNKTSVNETKMQLTQMSCNIEKMHLENEIFELKTKINMYRFMAGIEGILLICSIIASFN